MKIDFDTLNQKVEDRFGHLTLTVGGEDVVLRSPSRALDREGRKEFQEKLRALDGVIEEFRSATATVLDDAEGDEGEEAAVVAVEAATEQFQSRYIESVAAALGMVCSSGNFGKLQSVLGDDFPLWNELLPTYFEAVKAGEA